MNMQTIKSWLFDIQEDTPVKHSRWGWLISKLPLLMAMYVSSILVGISIYATFPLLYDPVLQGNITSEVYDFLRRSASIIGGLSYDVIITAVVFSLRKNKISYLTILAALATGLSMALDLYLQLHQTWLHALPIVMSVLFALHLATTRGLNIKELDIRLQYAENTTLELQRTNAELSRTNTELTDTTRELEDTNKKLKDRVENYTEAIIEKLSTKTELTANEIILVVGGNRSTVLDKVRTYRAAKE